VTQVVSADEGHVFHNRLTHSIQVAQVGRRIAEKLRRELWSSSQKKHDLDPDVVEAACLAHDMGHPPFGHIAEKELDRLATNNGLPDGFEGNAQSFRIVTCLASTSSVGKGLNITRASLNAILKYPWLRGENKDKKDKWGAYESERHMFNWVRELAPPEPERKFEQSAEAKIMDLADDITYSVHDVDDFYRAGLIPIDRLRVDPGERQRFYEDVFERRADSLPFDMDKDYLISTFDKVINAFPQDQPYRGTLRDRGLMRDLTATLIGTFVKSMTAKIGEDGRAKITMPKKRRAAIFMLKQLTWYYVIKNPALASQQHGQRMIIRSLFHLYRRATTDRDEKNLDVFPVGVGEELKAIHEASRPTMKLECTRLVIDFIASLTEEQTIYAHQRLTGQSLGSALLFRLR
jgi:dGTPase